MRVQLVNWIVKHQKWIEQINLKNHKLSDYLCDLVQPNFKLDKTALMIYAQMYHMDLGVVLHKSYWCAANHDDIFKAKVIFAFTGKLRFLDTCPVQGIFQVRDKSPEKNNGKIT